MRARKIIERIEAAKPVLWIILFLAFITFVILNRSGNPSGIELNPHVPAEVKYHIAGIFTSMMILLLSWLLMAFANTFTARNISKIKRIWNGIIMGHTILMMAMLIFVFVYYGFLNMLLS